MENPKKFFYDDLLTLFLKRKNDVDKILKFLDLYDYDSDPTDSILKLSEAWELKSEWIWDLLLDKVQKTDKAQLSCVLNNLVHLENKTCNQLKDILVSTPLYLIDQYIQNQATNQQLDELGGVDKIQTKADELFKELNLVGK